MAIKDELRDVQSGKERVNDLVDVALQFPGISTSVNVITSIASTIGNVQKTVQSNISDAAMINNIVSTAEGSIGASIDKTVPAVATTVKNAITSLTYPDTLTNPNLNPAHINFQFYKKGDVRSTSINLPMPDNVSNPSTIEWDQESFGMIGDTILKSIKSIESGQANQGSIEAQINAMSERIKSLAFYNGMSNIANGLGGNASAAGLMGAASGKVPNPYRTFLFRGVDFRTFTFEFRFVPFKESDCTLIDNIIKKFREHSYPDFAADKMFFTYPDECQITYMWESGPNKWLNNFKRAVCTGIDINFAPMGQWSSLRNGFPNMIVLSTKWTEVEIITKGDISNKVNGQRS